MTDAPRLPVTPVPPVSAAAAALLVNFKAIDPQRQGVGLDRIRPFYPKVAWSEILEPAKELIQAGLLKKRPVMNNKGTVGYEIYTW